jgi:pyruvate,water dikinase
MPSPKLFQLQDADLPRGLGGKVDGLRWLAENGYPIPPTRVLVNPSRHRRANVTALAGVLGDGPGYAVRSSANVEDGGSISYAGQFESFLDVRGVDAIADAVVAVVESADAEGITAYRAHQGDERPIEMTTIIQDMVRPTVSGVAFSRNPITGLSETVVEAVEGDGHLLVADGATPNRWVHRWGDLIEEPSAGVLEPATVRSIVSAVAEIAHRYGAAVDLEWVYDGARVWWVQVRPITGLEDVTIYSRRIAKEVMPGIIKPLVWSVNVPMVNEAWIELFREALGDVALEPDDLARSFAYRSYFNMTAIGEIFEVLGMPRESLELLLGLPAGSEQPTFKPTAATMRKLPRMLAMALRKARYGGEIRRELPELESEYARYGAADLAAIPDAGLMADIDELRRIGVRSAGINVVTPLLANAYGALLRAQLSPYGLTLADVDLLTEGIDHDHGLDPNPHLDRLAERVAALDESQREAIGRDGYEAVPEDLRDEIDRFLDRFGHFSDSGNDFSVAPWREMPDTVVRMIASRSAAMRAVDRVQWSTAEMVMPAWRRPLTRVIHARATTFMRYRDEVSSLYTYGYGQFRRYFLEIGRRLVERDVLERPDDVMYLTVDELASAFLGGDGSTAAGLVNARRREIDEVADLVMPDIIFGDDFVPAIGADDGRTQWRGTPTSRGTHRGVTRVVAGITDFERVADGDILVIPFSDVGWTPLFGRAGAVVAESGGMLSHSSIVAREYGIPCVVSVTGAMGIPDGVHAVVDGYRGLVTLEDRA